MAIRHGDWRTCFAVWSNTFELSFIAMDYYISGTITVGKSVEQLFYMQYYAGIFVYGAVSAIPAMLISFLCCNLYFIVCIPLSQFLCVICLFLICTALRTIVPFHISYKFKGIYTVLDFVIYSAMYYRLYSLQ